jgi:hypothetical protein
MIFIAYLILTILAAVTDALFFNGDKSTSKIVEGLFQLTFLFIPLLYYKNKINFKFLTNILLMYVFIRWSIFDMVFNVTSGLDINYVGTTTPIYDNIMNSLSGIMFWFVRAFSMFVALAIYFKTIKK